MEIKILKNKWWERRKLVKNRGFRQCSQSWDIRNTSSISELYEIALSKRC